MTHPLATAFVLIRPTTTGFGPTLKRELDGAAGAAGKSGRKAGESWTKGFQSSSLTKAAKKITEGVIGIGAASVYAAVKFQTSMAKLSTQAGVSQGKIAGLSAGGLKLAGQVGFSPDSLSVSLYHVESNFGSLAARTAAGAKSLAALGIKTGQLARDMQKGGLRLALEDLVKRMRRAGISADQQGAIITTAFGKKAGVGLSILAGQMTRFESKYPALSKGAGEFGKAWAQTQKLAGQQFKELTQGLVAIGVKIGTRLLPPLMAVFGFIRTHTGLVLTSPASWPAWPSRSRPYPSRSRSTRRQSSWRRRRCGCSTWPRRRTRSVRPSS